LTKPDQRVKSVGVSVFFCDCGKTLNQFVNFETLVEASKNVEGVTSVQVHSSLCQENGLETIQEKIKEGKPQAIVIAACSKRFYKPMFETLTKKGVLNPFLAEIVNIREQCCWVHPKKDEATAKAKRLILAGIEKAKNLKPVETKQFKIQERALVIGAGVAGIQAALDLANQGFKVYLLDQSPTIGGKMALLVKTYPTDDCAICILGPKMADAAAHPNIQLLTYHDVVYVKKNPAGFRVKVRKKPRYVDVEKCTGCGMCAEKCPVKVPNEWNGGLGYRKAIYIPYPQALPKKYVVDAPQCLYFQKGVCKICEKICPAKAPCFEQKPEETQLEVGAVIVATGFDEFDPSSLPKYGYKKLKDVVTQFQLARILDPSGPTSGKLKRPSDSEKPKRIVMIQCVGSRDPKVNAYCSRYCCMAAMKNAMLIKVEQDPDADITVLYKDVRAAGKGFEEYYVRAKERYGIKFVKGELIQVSQDFKANELKIEYETPANQKAVLRSDLVVLSCAVVPSKGLRELAKIIGVKIAPDGFLKELDDKVSSVETSTAGVYVCGVAEGPKDIPESVAQASAAASKAALKMAEIVQKPMLIPVIEDEFCSRCRLCEGACPFRAIVFDEKKEEIKVDETSCTGCGLCVTACGANAIQLINNEYGLVSRQIRSVLTGADEKLKPIIIAFCCDECGYTALDNVGFRHQHYPAGIIPIFVPCLSGLSVQHVIEALTLGAEDVLILGCQDERCHFEEGVAKARMRMGLIKKVFHEVGIFANRVHVLPLSGSMVQEFTSMAGQMAKQSHRRGRK